MSKVYSIKCTQVIPVSINEAWNYFSKPDNLAEITPASLGFVIKSRHHGNTIYAGLIIEYVVRPVAGIPVYWMTEITHVEHLKYFVDEQRFGPYSLWHHQHHFKEVDGGVEITDIVHYKVPFWFAGDIANALMVKKKLKEIFDYRREKIEAIFNSKAKPG